MDSLIVRDAPDDFQAFLIAKAMQSMYGVDVISVVYLHVSPVQWRVYAKFDSSEVTCSQINAVIDRELGL